MSNARTSIAVLALIAAACGSGDEGSAAPTVTETVTVTASDTPRATASSGAATASPIPTASPSPTTPVASPSGPAETAPDACSELGDEGAGLAFIFVTTPAPGAAVSSGFDVAGCANTFEASYLYRLESGGEVLAEGFGTASCGNGCVGDFSFTVDYELTPRDPALGVQVGTLTVFEESAEDGSEQSVNSIPVRLQVAG